MTLNEIVTNRNNKVTVDLSDYQINTHFLKQSSYTNIIIDQINRERIYDKFFDKSKVLTVLDIGANVGLFSLYAQDEKNKVYALEPTPTHFELLKKITAPYKTVKPFNIALSPIDGEITFYLSDENSTMNSINNKYGKAINVNGVRLDTFIKENKIKNIDFIKLDIEGSEMLALTEEIIGNVKDVVKVWFIEAHATTSDNRTIEDNRNILIQRFGNVGVTLEKYRNDGLISK